MTEDEVVETLRKHFESLFPRVCPSCGRHFNTLREYILTTKRIGTPLSYDAELGQWDTVHPIGSIALANCPCGTTIALGTEDMPMPLRLALLSWIRTETQQRGRRPAELLEHLRNKVREQVANKQG